MKPMHLHQIERLPVEEVIKGLKDSAEAVSLQSGFDLTRSAREHGISLRNYLNLSVKPTDSSLNGYETTLAALGLPVRNDLDHGITLQAAADTFQTFGGVRALFPEVIDDVVQWKYRQNNLETLDSIISQSRDINGNEMVSTIITDSKEHYEAAVVPIAERGKIPTHSVSATDKSVKIYKYGEAYSFSYEFMRRISLDIVAPYQARTLKNLEIAKVGQATNLIINGDNVAPAATVVNQSSFDGAVGTSATANQINPLHLLKWLVSRAQAGAPVDTVIGNYDTLFLWLKLVGAPAHAGNVPDAQALNNTGFTTQMPDLGGPIKFALSSQAPANQLIGLTKAETIEELKETGSNIEESGTSIDTQEIKVTKTENSGFRLIFDDTREIYDFAN